MILISLLIAGAIIAAGISGNGQGVLLAIVVGAVALGVRDHERRRRLW
jgi:outer membrane lipoprotein SlyB